MWYPAEKQYGLTTKQTFKIYTLRILASLPDVEKKEIPINLELFKFIFRIRLFLERNVSLKTVSVSFSCLCKGEGNGEKETLQSLSFNNNNKNELIVLDSWTYWLHSGLGIITIELNL